MAILLKRELKFFALLFIPALAIFGWPGVVRVNFNHGELYIVPKEGLQSKEDRYYFIETIRLERGKVYVSPLDLNVEKAEVEGPPNPVIRKTEVQRRLR